MSRSFTACDVVELYLHRGAFEPTLSGSVTKNFEPRKWHRYLQHQKHYYGERVHILHLFLVRDVQVHFNLLSFKFFATLSTVQLCSQVDNTRQTILHHGRSILSLFSTGTHAGYPASYQRSTNMVQKEKRLVICILERRHHVFLFNRS
jgi:hypothetical protein